jgi:predicted cupin superfamily sugar epimerase
VTAPRTAAEWIDALGLVPHPEGGHYRETYRAPSMITPFGGDARRSLSTAIYFLLQGHEVSALHRLRADELWHFHTGSTLRVVELTPDGALHEHRLGLDVGADERPQVAIPAGSWFGARTTTSTGFTLVGCTVAPGFDFADFELGEEAELRARYGRHAAIIDTFIRRPRPTLG